MLTMTKPRENFKLVPDSLEDITTEWCNKVLKDGSCISSDIQVTNVEVKRLTNETSDTSDGGGLSGSMMIKLIPTFRLET